MPRADALHSTYRAAINRDCSAIDVAGEWGGEKRDEVPDVIRLPEIASGDVLRDEVRLRLLCWMQFLNLGRVDATRCDRVDGDTIWTEF